jgi:hypothetical protein
VKCLFIIIFLYSGILPPAIDRNWLCLLLKSRVSSGFDNSTVLLISEDLMLLLDWTRRFLLWKTLMLLRGVTGVVLLLDYRAAFSYNSPGMGE